MDLENIFKHDTEIEQINERLNNLRTQIAKIIIGQEQVVNLLIVGLLSDGHLLLEGVPGVAKTLTSKLLAKLIEVPFSRIQFTPDLMPSDVIGTTVFNPKDVSFEFKKGPVFSSIVLIDEINRAPAKTQAALFEVMEERQITVDGTTYRMHEPFVIVATQNPIEQEGTYRLPEAQLDRFLFKINLNYPTLEEEIEVLQAQQGRSQKVLLDSVVPVLSFLDVLAFRSATETIAIDEKLVAYIAQIVNATRNNASLYLGASPRASLALLKSSKAMALLAGRNFVIPEDIKYLAPYVLNHRIMLTPEKEMEGITTKQVVDNIIKQIEIPR